MAGQIPSYLVRNLVEVSLKRTECKTPKKTRTKTLCVAIPTETKNFTKEGSRLQEIKDVLRLHKHFEKQAELFLRNHVVTTEQEYAKHEINSHFVGNRKTNGQDSYLNEMLFKLTQPSSPELPALTSCGNTSKHLHSSLKNQISFPQIYVKENTKFALPSLAETPSYLGEKSPSREDFLQGNLKFNVEKDAKNSREFFALEENLTVVPLTRENFASYDSLSTLYGVRSNSSPRSTIERSRKSESPLRILVSIPDSRSEDGMFVDYEEYVKDKRDEVGENAVPTLALVEFKPKYKRNVHFSEHLHEVHLYSPVQNHSRRKRPRRNGNQDH